MSEERKFDTWLMHQSPRCGAKTRRGTPCMSPAVKGKRRCRMHGGAPGSGAPKGNKNALKHGFYTRKAIEQRKALRQLIRQAEELLEEID
jgi:glucans biosynthesis protein